MKDLFSVSSELTLVQTCQYLSRQCMYSIHRALCTLKIPGMSFNKRMRTLDVDSGYS